MEIFYLLSIYQPRYQSLTSQVGASPCSREQLALYSSPKSRFLTCIVGPSRESRLLHLQEALGQYARQKWPCSFQFCRGQNGRGNIGANLSTDPTTPREDVLSRCNHRRYLVIELVIDTRLLKCGTRKRTAVQCSDRLELSRAKTFVPSSSRNTPAQLQQEQTSAAPLDQPPLIQ